ncbi:MAG: UDP-N-acetylmuramoyl-L-alanine--D-glutamate ligase [Clostridia bacterium]|nr:UDP-N-acetylmuramoyl-L-alanine--D-glutamate ligase [Clostridia bacterium]
MHIGEFADKKVLVVGMARSGVAAAKLLASAGIDVTINDSKSAQELGDALKPLEGYAMDRQLGKAAMECLEGKDILVLSPGIPDKAAFVVKAKEMGIRVIAEIELAYEMSDGEMVAITGTNGKTTTVTLLNQIFLDAGFRSQAVGNIGYPYAEGVMGEKAGDRYVCECSSFQMETVDGFHPRAAALLNITEDHLNRHGTMAEYTRLKMRMFEKQTEADYAVFNADDPALAGLDGQVRSRTLFFSRKGEVENGCFLRGDTVVFRLDGKETEIIDRREIYIPGPHNLENAMAAICLAMVSGISAESMAHTLRTFQGVEHRIEFTRELRGVRYYNDSKGTNVDSTVCAVRTMDRPTVIILGGSDKHCDFTPLAKSMLASDKIREAVLIGVTAQQIEDTLKTNGFTAITRASSMEDAVERATKLSSEGWNVLLSPACASFDMFHDYEERGRIFKEIVRSL